MTMVWTVCRGTCVYLYILVVPDIPLDAAVILEGWGAGAGAGAEAAAGV